MESRGSALSIRPGGGKVRMRSNCVKANMEAIEKLEGSVTAHYC